RLLSVQPTLLVLDNFEVLTDERIITFLSKLPNPTKALVTSRSHGLGIAWTLKLEALTDEEALTLIQQEVKRLDLLWIVNADRETLLPLVLATNGNPLAIQIALGQIALGVSLEAIIKALREGSGNFGVSEFF